MKKLKQELRILSKIDAIQIKRTERVALYKRSDGYYEVFLIRIQPAEICFGRPYPDRELYPASSQFGLDAICTQFLEKAEKYYQEFNQIN